MATPTTYSLSQPQVLPQTTFTDNHSSWWGGSRTDTDQGVAVETLVNAAQPTRPAAKNALLRVTIAISGAWGRSETFALGELDPSFGNHPAYLALQKDGRPLPAPELVVPGDINPAHSVTAVDRTIAVQDPAPTTPPAAGAVTVEDGPHTTVLSSTQLAALPARTLDVTFQAGTQPSSMSRRGRPFRTCSEPPTSSWASIPGSPPLAPTGTSRPLRLPRHGSVPVRCLSR